MIKKDIKSFLLRNVLGKPIPISLSTEENKIRNSFPLKLDTVYCVLNFDDLSPIPEKSKYIGRGGNLNDFVNIKQRKLLELFPFLGITHFMVPKFIPADFFYVFNNERYSVLNQDNQEWIEYHIELSQKFNIEYACHGLYHRQSENLLFSRHTEFAYLDYNHSLKRIQESLDIFRRIGINPMGFRQPGWDINSNLSIIDAVKASGLKYGGFSSYNAGLNSNKQRVSFFHPTYLKGIINFPDNINIDWPLETIKSTIRKIVSEKGIISIKGHFSKGILTNSLSEENFKKIIETIKFIISENNDTVTFGTFKEVYQTLIKSEVYLRYLGN